MKWSARQLVSLRTIGPYGRVEGAEREVAVDSRAWRGVSAVLSAPVRALPGIALTAIPNSSIVGPQHPSGKPDGGGSIPEATGTVGAARVMPLRLRSAGWLRRPGWWRAMPREGAMARR
jgi:hypothetical protein